MTSDKKHTIDKKLLVICGPTATGKTSLGIKLAKRFGGEIVSADSRQVYRVMDIGTGKGLPRISNFQFPISNLKKRGIGCYVVRNMRVWGYDLVDPKQEFSVAHYQKFAKIIVQDIWGRRRLPILVGGTGLYIKAVVNGIPTATVPKNKKLRDSLEEKVALELFDILAQLDPAKAASLNVSDKKNPRRLIRAIEVAQFLSGKHSPPMNRFIGGDDVMLVGLKASMTGLRERIGKRVKKRLETGFEMELEKLLASGVDWDDQAMQSLGYKQWRGYVEGKITKKEARLSWINEEVKYAKRQMTWFKRDKKINWFDTEKKGYGKAVEKLVSKWYSSGR